MAFDQITTIFLAVLFLTIGTFIIKKVGIFQRFCIPAPVVGGLLFALIVTIFKSIGFEITLDTSLQSLFMITFFTTVGLGASFKLVKLGGKLLIIYWLACGFLALMQNVIGVGLASLLGIEPLIGMMAGAVSMEGGHGAAAAFGQTLEELGFEGAMTVGAAAATLGLVAGGLVGGPAAKHLISKYDLKPSKEEMEVSSLDTDHEQVTTQTFFTQVLIITFCMTVGSYLGKWFSELTDFVLPGYVGAMFVAVIVRNILDKIKPGAINMKTVSIIGDITLGIFLSMALMSIKLWEITDLALPLLIIVLVQVIFIVLLAMFVLFRLLGKNYDAAVMISGFLGHGLGATPNAMANMHAIVGRFGPSQKAFLVVPIVGAFLIDVFGIPIIITTINLFK
ncbi:sodium/glutamate symporter [Ureibacillus thermosphaericus]|uniref:Sodium/glutamate symporter n=1 Tax=Ureibacillus thermosphaericus TaxID=51173 RepID=A0A840PUW6_URETH|nr:sodium/glutamate symporter [Ureibacillus thermosphaericus]MBB5149670.1 ESS family glutamate:Na+ symporter [Ureibacillus thermosphaericus]NKZ32422.1 sodium/glutamate symporter [Ureibacillus thermosphaericus]